MENGLKSIKIFFVGVVGAISAAFGYMGILALILVCAMCLDWITGSVYALRTHSWQSAIAREGLKGKGWIVLGVFVAGLADALIYVILQYFPLITLPFGLEYNAPFLTLALIWYIVTELGSIIENIANMSGNVPPFLKNLIALLKSKTESAGDSMAGENENKTE